MKISILLPYKENYAINTAGAVSLFVNDIVNKSIYKKTIKITTIWRVLKNKQGNVLKRIWIDQQKVGNQELGKITHDYVLNKKDA